MLKNKVIKFLCLTNVGIPDGISKWKFITKIQGIDSKRGSYEKISVIIYLQKNHIDTNNYMIDNIKNEGDEKKKQKLILDLKNQTSIDFNSSGYVVALFTIFNGNEHFCI